MGNIEDKMVLCKLCEDNSWSVVQRASTIELMTFRIEQSQSSKLASFDIALFLILR
jgi:hypothetical protein